MHIWNQLPEKMLSDISAVHFDYEKMWLFVKQLFVRIMYNPDSTHQKEILKFSILKSGIRYQPLFASYIYRAFRQFVFFLVFGDGDTDSWGGL